MIVRCQIAFPYDSALPRDVLTITPHYNTSDPQALCNALKANLQTLTGISATGIFVIKAYDAEKPPPSYPIATASLGTGFKASTVPRELALCLSYYGGFNRPRFRGRLYIPMPIIAGNIGAKPTSTQQTDVLNWAGALGKNLPSNTFWTVWSRVDKRDAQVTNTWVDDEWDVVRSRGLKPSSRVTGTLP
jgi:hypothetical protein